MTERSRKPLVTLVILLVVAVTSLWLYCNPPGRFGYCRFGLTVYSGIPFPAVDVIVRPNGLPSIRTTKAHRISVEEFDRLLGPSANRWPQVIIIGTGYQAQVQVDERIVLRSARPPMEVLPTPQAVRRFNELRTSGVRVAAIIHSTC